ncbi:NrsF family protein [Notoacmeibacter sp. MSK16QG-6]|uniref:NrsF family protein n=1 Tax=Notoacmeibacter sp. MSK16QG-6 TaxID=2957982 RepID=UPI0020A007C0|nr:NrsF family protein [Notoacmeibacter sp. MSK16QG-6]MCP1198091.1 NrsF family protein [Notoacmeibacter sp. MSK16QG-6]
MRTSQLIDQLGEDAATHPPKRPLPWALVITGALLAGALLMFSLFSIRPDLSRVAMTYGFLLKPGVAALVAIPALRLIVDISHPTGEPMRHLPWLAVGLVVLVLGVATEMMLIPPVQWSARLIGYNPAACATSVFLLAIPIVAIMIFAIRQRATVRPVLAGSLAGLFGGAVATFLYAVHCPDDSPFFLAVWYGLAILLLMGIGALAGRFFLRW